MLLLRGATALRSTSNQTSPRFNTCSSCEEQRFRAFKVSIISQFQYMLLLRGATVVNKSDEPPEEVSIHAPLARSNFPFLQIRANLSLFQYMLLLRGATGCERIWSKYRPVSIHAPLARSNDEAHDILGIFELFQYMLLLRGATPCPSPSLFSHARFNTCSSCEEQLL